jgi:alpha-glucoside transport system substrate-binding protein
MAKIAADADVFRFDGSDLMPKEVGSGTFWTGMVEWMSGASSQAAADKIEASWPKTPGQAS